MVTRPDPDTVLVGRIQPDTLRASSCYPLSASSCRDPFSRLPPMKEDRDCRRTGVGCSIDQACRANRDLRSRSPAIDRSGRSRKTAKCSHGRQYGSGDLLSWRSAHHGATIDSREPTHVGYPRPCCRRVRLRADHLDRELRRDARRRFIMLRRSPHGSSLRLGNSLGRRVETDSRSRRRSLA